MHSARWRFLWGLALGLSTLVPFWKLTRPPEHRCYSDIPVVVVTGDLPAGHLLTLDDLSQRSTPERVVPSDAVKPDSAGFAVGQRLIAPLAAGDSLRWHDLIGGTLKLDVQKKARATTITLDHDRAVDGKLFPGDHVDVLATMVDPQTNERVARTLIQNVIILSITHRLAPEPESVTLLVIPEEAEELLLNQDIGRFALTLRNPDDLEMDDQPGRTTINTLLSGERWHYICHYRHPVLTVIRGADAGH